MSDRFCGGSPITRKSWTGDHACPTKTSSAALQGPEELSLFLGIRGKVFQPDPTIMGCLSYFRTPLHGRVTEPHRVRGTEGQEAVVQAEAPQDGTDRQALQRRIFSRGSSSTIRRSGGPPGKKRAMAMIYGWGRDGMVCVMHLQNGMPVPRRRREIFAAVLASPSVVRGVMCVADECAPASERA